MSSAQRPGDSHNSQDKKPKFRIGEILVNHGYMTGEELKKAFQVQKESYKPLGQVCVDLGYISSVDLTRILREHRRHMYLGELLVNMGIINEKQLEKVLQKQKLEKKRVGELLIELGYLTEDQLVRSLSMQLGIPIITPDLQLIDQKLARRFNEAFLRRQMAVPAFERDGVVILIMADPLAELIISDFKKYFNIRIEPAMATGSSINRLLDALFNKIEYGQKELSQRDEIIFRDKGLMIRNEGHAQEKKDNTVGIVNYIISSAISEGASDIGNKELFQHQEIRMGPLNRFRTKRHQRFWGRYIAFASMQMPLPWNRTVSRTFFTSIDCSRGKLKEKRFQRIYCRTLLDLFSTPELSDKDTLQGEGSAGPGQEEFHGPDKQLSGDDLSAVEESTLERVAFLTHIEEISFERFLTSRLKKIDSRLSREVK